MKIINYICLALSSIFLSSQIQAQGIEVKSDYPYPEAERYISAMLEKPIPYTKQVLNVHWTISDHKSYPPGALTQVFAEYLTDNNIIKDKIVADLGSSCFAIGVIAAKNGAKEVIGTSITPESANNARENIVGNNVSSIARVLDGVGVNPLLPRYKGKVDVIVQGLPWSTISEKELNTVPEPRKALTKLFYDVDDRVVNDVLSKASLLLAPDGKIYITASLQIMDRIKRICDAKRMDYAIVKEEDIHEDGNIHYILRLSPKL